MSDIENIVLEMLVPIFPNLTHDVLETSVKHPSNHGVPLTVDSLLQRCIDDLLELRTFTNKTASYRQPPAMIYSDDSNDGDKDTSNENITSLKHKQSRNKPDIIITGHTPSKVASNIPSKQSIDDVEITGHTPSKDCMIVPDKSTEKQAKRIKLSKPVENVAIKIKETIRTENIEKTASTGRISHDDIYREIEFSSDSSNSSVDLPKISESSEDEDHLPVLRTPTKCSPIKLSKLSGSLQKPASTPDFSNWRDCSKKSPSGTSVVSTDKSIINGRKDLLVKSNTVPKIQTADSSSLTDNKGSLQLSPNQGQEQNRGLTATFNVNNSTDNMNVNITVNLSNALGENIRQNKSPMKPTGYNHFSHTPSSSGRKMGEQQQTYTDHRHSSLVVESRPQVLKSSSMPNFAAQNEASLKMPRFPGLQSNNVRNKNLIPSSAIHMPVLHNVQQANFNVLPANRPSLLHQPSNIMKTAVTNTVTQPQVLQMRPQLSLANSTITRPQNPHVLQAFSHEIQNLAPHTSQIINHNLIRPLAASNHPRPIIMPTAVNIIPRPTLPGAHLVYKNNMQQPIPAGGNTQPRAQINNNDSKARMELQEKFIIPVADEEVVTTTNPVIQIDDDKKQGRSETIQIPDTTVIIPEEETPEMKIIKKKKNLRTEMIGMFPDVDPNYIDELYDRFNQFSWEMLTMNVCNTILENPQYPRKKTAVFEEKKVVPNVDYYKEYSSSVTVFYRNQCEMLLQSEFKWISLKDIRTIMKCYNNHYAPSHKAITAIMKKRTEEFAKIKEKSPFIHPYSQAKVETTVDGIYGERSISITFLKCGRPHRSESPVSPELLPEKEFIKIKAEEEAKEIDHMLAVNINEHEYEESGQLIECGCCYGEVAFENMIQCYEGHLFCQECLQRYAQESVFGHGKADLLCMTDGCDANYPISQLKKALPSNILSKYEDRVQEENINLADLTDLVRCPGCDFAALLDEGDKVFKCHNTSCLKETCRYCKEDWKEHFGKRCDEIEKKDEVKLRLQFEEKMTEAKIRTCHKCKARFTKLDGCNKMTCRCGAKMCYICRKPNIDYEHFCRHFLDPSKGKTCTQCTACSLWTNPEQDDERAVSEIKKEAGETRKALGFEDEKLIGVPDEPPSKRPRLEKQGNPQVHIQII